MNSLPGSSLDLRDRQLSEVELAGGMAAAWICGRGRHHRQRRHVVDTGCSAVRAG